ncbi:hypothetical protein JL720_15735 [Aureococcus anophagefferens]|nr:hypothetical protein JL720_15735 [Aureococcus anophagefferens]
MGDEVALKAHGGAFVSLKQLSDFVAALAAATAAPAPLSGAARETAVRLLKDDMFMDKVQSALVARCAGSPRAEPALRHAAAFVAVAHDLARTARSTSKRCAVAAKLKGLVYQFQWYDVADAAARGSRRRRWAPPRRPRSRRRWRRAAASRRWEAEERHEGAGGGVDDELAVDDAPLEGGGARKAPGGGDEAETGEVDREEKPDFYVVQASRPSRKHGRDVDCDVECYGRGDANVARRQRPEAATHHEPLSATRKELAAFQRKVDDLAPFPFIMENNDNMLKKMPWMEEYEPFRRETSCCRYDGNSSDFEHNKNLPRGQQRPAAEERLSRNVLPRPPRRRRRAMEEMYVENNERKNNEKGKLWILDLGSGYQSLRGAVEDAGFVYVPVDRVKRVGDCDVELCLDFSKSTMLLIIYSIVKHHDLELRDLHVNKKKDETRDYTVKYHRKLKKSRGSWARDYLDPRQGAEGDAARAADSAVQNLKYAQEILRGAKTWEGRAYAGWATSVLKDDYVTFKVGSGEERVIARILEVRWFRSFEAMLKNCGLGRCLPGVRTIAEGVAIYRKFRLSRDGRSYAEVEPEVGVVAFRLRPLS